MTSADFDIVIDQPVVEVDISSARAVTLDVLGVDPVQLVELAIGVPGPAGPAGSAFHFRQATPAAEWIVEHGQGTKPSISVFVDDLPDVPVWTDLSYPDLTTVVITLPEPHSGDIYI